MTTSYIYELELHLKDIAEAKRYYFEQLQAIAKSHNDDLELQNQSHAFSLSEAEKKILAAAASLQPIMIYKGFINALVLA
jgi:hypothetical protein